MQSGVGYAAADTWSSSRIKHLAGNFLCSSSQHVDFGTPALLTLVRAASRGSRPATLWCGEFGKHPKSGESGEITRRMLSSGLAKAPAPNLSKGAAISLAWRHGFDGISAFPVLRPGSYPVCDRGLPVSSELELRGGFLFREQSPASTHVQQLLHRR